MKIALFVHCFFPEHFYGTETYTLEVARNLQELGHEPVVVAGVFQGEPTREGLVTEYEYQGIPVVAVDKNHLPHQKVGETYYQAAMGPVLTGVLERLGPDIVHVTHLINHTAVLLEVVQALGIPAVATLTDFFGFCFNNKLEAADGSLCSGPSTSRLNCLACYLKARAGVPGRSRLERLGGRPRLAAWAARGLYLSKRLGKLDRPDYYHYIDDILQRPDVLAGLYRNYRAVIAPTRFLGQAYRENGLAVPMHTHHFGIDVARDRSKRPSEQGRIRFGYIGQIAPHKGTDVLVEAFSSLPGADAELYVYGPEDQDPRFMERLRRIADPGRVYFKGTFPKEEMAAVFDNIDFFVIPSLWYENSPLVLLYALATHTPVIVSDVAGLTEFVQDGVNGFAFEKGSVSALKGVMERILGAPDTALGMSESTRYEKTTRDMTREVLGVYDAVLEAG